MNKFLFSLKFISLFLLLLLQQTTSSAEDIGEKSENRQWHEKKRYAFLVGINKYKNTTELKYAVKDSKEMYKLFTQVGHFEKIFMLNDEDGKVIVTKGKIESRDKQYLPTKVNIEETYKSILAEKPDTLVFYYSGHGFIDGKDDKNSIAPMDVEVNFEKDKAIAKNGIVITEMANGFKTEADKDKSEIDQIIFLIDACRSPLPKADTEEVLNPNKKELAKEDKSKAVNTGNPEPSKEVTKESSKEEATQKLISFQNYGEEIPQIVNDAKGVVILIGTSPNQASLEDESIESGKFTYYMRKAISGGVQDETPAEYVTLESLELFVKKKFDLEQIEYDRISQEKGIGEISQGKPKQAVYKVSTQRGFTGDFLITYGRPPETEVRVERRGYMDSTEERPVAAKVLFNKNKERYDLKFFAKSKDTGKYYPESLEGVSRMKYDFDRTKTGDLKGFTAEQYNYKEEPIYTHGLELDEENGWEFTSLYPLTEEDKKDKDKKRIRFQRQKFDFNGNNILQEYFDDKGSRVAIGYAGITKTIRAWDYNGEKTLEEFYNAKGELTNNENGYARYTASYLGKGKPVSEEYFGSDGKLSGNQTGIARKMYTYDPGYKLVSQQNFDKEGKRIGDKDEVAVTNYTYNNACVDRLLQIELKGSVGERSRTTENYEAVGDKAKSELTEKFKRKETYADCIETEAYLDKSEKPRARPNGIAKNENQFNEKGLKTLEQYFRHDERPWHKGGIFRTVYAYDDKDRVTAKKFFGETRNTTLEPVPVTDERGIHEYRYQYGTTGGGKYQFVYKKELLERVTYHGLDGKLVSTADGISIEEHLFTYNREIKDYEEAVVHYLDAGEGFVRADKGDTEISIYNADKNEIFWEKLQFNRKLKLGQDGFARRIDQYKSKNKFQSERYDEKGNLSEDKYGYSIYRIQYDAKNNIVRREYFDRNGKLTGGKEGIARWINQYDEKNNLIEFEGYDEKGNLCNHSTGIARWVNRYDERNNLVLIEYFDRNGILTGGKEGFARKIYNYDERNNHILTEFYDEKGNLFEDTHGNAKYLLKYDNRNNKVLIEQFDKNGNLTGGKDGIARLINQYDNQNNLILTEFYDEKGNLVEDNYGNAKYLSKYDDRNNILLTENFDRNRNLTDGKDGIASWISQYDDRNNKILAERRNAKGNLAEDEYGKARYEYLYDNPSRDTVEKEFRSEWGQIQTLLIDTLHGKEFKERQLSIEKQISFWQKKFKEKKADKFILEEELKKNLGSERGARLIDNFYDFTKKFTKELENCILRKVSYKADGTLVERKERFDRFHLLTTEKPDSNGVLESPEYNLYFPNPRGQFEKRLLHMKLDRFYRPVGLEFEKR